MKQTKLILIFLILLSLCSCQNSNEINDITGKWYHFSEEDGYIEFKINSSEIYAFSHSEGNMPYFGYEIYKDSLRNLNNNISMKIIIIPDSILVLQSTYDTATLVRLPDSIITFHEINSKNDSIITSFYNKFQQRAFKTWIKHGYTEEDYNKSLIDTCEIDEEILLMNIK